MSCAHGTILKGPTAGSACPSAPHGDHPGHSTAGTCPGACSPGCLVSSSCSCYAPSPVPKPAAQAVSHKQLPAPSPPSGGSRQGRAGMGLGERESREMVGDRDTGPRLEGVTPVTLPVPLTTTLQPRVVHHQTTPRPRCRARRVPPPARPRRWPVTVGTASARSWPATSLRRVPTAPTRSAVVRATGDPQLPSSQAAQGTRAGRPGHSLARRGDMGAHAAPGKHGGPMGLSLGFCRSHHLRGGGWRLARRQRGAAALGRAEGH